MTKPAILSHPFFQRLQCLWRQWPSRGAFPNTLPNRLNVFTFTFPNCFTFRSRKTWKMITRDLIQIVSKEANVETWAQLIHSINIFFTPGSEWWMGWKVLMLIGHSSIVGVFNHLKGCFFSSLAGVFFSHLLQGCLQIRKYSLIKDWLKLGSCPSPHVSHFIFSCPIPLNSQGAPWLFRS